MEKKLLEVGDVLYRYGQWNSMYKEVVTRVTKTLAICNSTRYRREIRVRHDGTLFVDEYGSYASGYLETEQHKNDYEERQLRRSLVKLARETNIDSLTLAQCNQLLTLLQSFQTPVT